MELAAGGHQIMNRTVWILTGGPHYPLREGAGPGQRSVASVLNVAWVAFQSDNNPLKGTNKHVARLLRWLVCGQDDCPPLSRVKTPQLYSAWRGNEAARCLDKVAPAVVTSRYGLSRLAVTGQHNNNRDWVHKRDILITLTTYATKVKSKY